MFARLTPSLPQSYNGLTDAVWVQEEPKNMGPWTFIASRLAPLLLSSAPLRYAGRPSSASLATGNAKVHKTELGGLLEEAFG